jgi:hypothetical protein
VTYPWPHGRLGKVRGRSESNAPQKSERQLRGLPASVLRSSRAMDFWVFSNNNALRLTGFIGNSSQHSMVALANGDRLTMRNGGERRRPLCNSNKRL